jgi:hypothetical protein
MELEDTIHDNAPAFCKALWVLGQLNLIEWKRHFYYVMLKFLTTNPEIVAGCLKRIHWRGYFCLRSLLGPSSKWSTHFCCGKNWSGWYSKLFVWVGKKFIYHFQALSQNWEKQLLASCLTVCLSVRSPVCLSVCLSVWNTSAVLDGWS